MKLVVLGLLSAAAHWLLARASITEPLWSRARGWFAKLLACPACSGWWIGLGWGVLGLRPVELHWRWLSVVASGLLGVVLTPVFEACLLWGLERSAIELAAPTDPNDPDDLLDD